MTDRGRPSEDLGAVFDAHVWAEFVDQDVAATMATMSPEPCLTHVPTLAAPGATKSSVSIATILSAIGQPTSRSNPSRARSERTGSLTN
jgi:hypothetical protein